MRRVIGATTTGSGLRDLGGEREEPPPLPSPAASATAVAVVLPPDDLYHGTRHNVRTLTFRDTRRKAIR